MTTATLPEPGTTTPITYTGNDGKSFTFYVKWPDSFTSVVDNSNGAADIFGQVADSNYHLDLSTLDPNDYYQVPNSEGTLVNVHTYGESQVG